MYLLFWESPGLAFGGLCCAGDRACCWARDGGCGPDVLDMAVKRIALVTGLVAIRDAMD